MSYYYKYDFCSPEPMYAVLKEELRTYFEAGAVDDLMFPIWTERALKKLGKSSYKILDCVLHVRDFQSVLPPDFDSVREAWLCFKYDPHNLTLPVQEANSYYGQDFIALSADGCVCPDPCNACAPSNVVRKTFKTTAEIQTFQNAQMWTRVYLLKPGNISVRANCALDCKNYGASSPDSFDIRDNKFVTNLRSGDVYLVYYAEERSENGHQLIPDNYWIGEYIKRYLKYKIFEQLFNQTTDETFNQIQIKMDYYKKSYDEGWVMADIEVKKQTAYQKQRAMRRDLNRLNMYKIK